VKMTKKNLNIVCQRCRTRFCV